MITFGNASIPNGLYHIGLDLDDYQSMFHVGSEVQTQENEIRIDHKVIMIPEESIYTYQYVKQIYSVTNQMILATYELLDFIKEQKQPHLFQHHPYLSTERYQFHKIVAFLFEPTLENARQILGLGMGLTPLGDDVLAGYLFASNAIGQSVSWAEELLLFAKEQTNAISYQELNNVIHHEYHDYHKAILQDFFEDHQTNELKKWVDFGASSGVGMLTGFCYGILEGVKSHERFQDLQEYIL